MEEGAFWEGICLPSRYVAAVLLAAALAFLPAPLSAESGLVRLTTANFAQTVNATSRPILVAFVAKWCRYCQRQIPDLQSLARNSNFTIDVYQVDVDEDPGIAAAYEAEVLPTLVILHEGTVIAGSAGALYGSDLTEWVAEAQKTIQARPSHLRE
jgi:thioredoxin-like negative regulator of GroEL